MMTFSADSVIEAWVKIIGLSAYFQLMPVVVSVVVWRHLTGAAKKPALMLEEAFE